MNHTDANEATRPGRRFVEPAIACAIFLVSLGWVDRSLHLTLELRDEGYLLYNIARVAAGDVPQRDFIEAYGPGVYALTAPIYHFSGERVMAVRELLAVFRAAAVTLAYLMARRLVPRPFALLGAAFSLGFWGWAIWNLATPYAALLTVPICMAAAWLALIGQKSGRVGAFFGSGLLCGVAMLFKWTLAAVTAYGLVLAVVGAAMLASRTERAPGDRSGLVLVAWAIAASLILVPFVSTLEPLDYALHFGPIQLAAAVIGVAFHRSGNGRLAVRAAWPAVFRLCAGFTIAPALTLALYWHWGSLGRLIDDVVIRPIGVQDYYVGIPLPSLGTTAAIVAVALGVTSGLSWLRARRIAAGGAAAGACVCGAAALHGVPDGAAPLEVLTALTFLLPALSAYATIGLLAIALRRPPGVLAESSAGALLIALFFQEMMTFQIYPRAGYNATLMLGTLGPLAALLAFRAHRNAIPAAQSDATARWRRALALALIASVPALFVSRQVRDVLAAPSPAELPETALRSPRLAGIHTKPDDYAAQSLMHFDELTMALAAAAPADAPVLVMNNESMIYLATGRDPVFEQHLMLFFLAGWGLLPQDDPDLPPPGELIRILDQAPDAIVVTRVNDLAVDEFRERFPELARHIRRHFRPVASIGDYRVLRRRAPARQVPDAD